MGDITCFLCGINNCKEGIMCQECIDRHAKNILKIRELEKEGHGFNCAFRQVHGDGECECHLQRQGYDSEWWVNNG